MKFWSVPAHLPDQDQIGQLEILRRRARGIVAERDYTRKVILKGRSSKDTPVSDIMTKEPLTVNPSNSATECMRIMTERRVRHLPVLEGTKLVGILSIDDVVNWLMAAQKATIDNLEGYSLAEIKEKNKTAYGSPVQPSGPRHYRRRNPPQPTSQRALRARHPLREGRQHCREWRAVFVRLCFYDFIGITIIP